MGWMLAGCLLLCVAQLSHAMGHGLTPQPHGRGLKIYIYNLTRINPEWDDPTCATAMSVTCRRAYTSTHTCMHALCACVCGRGWHPRDTCTSTSTGAGQRAKGCFRTPLAGWWLRSARQLEAAACMDAAPAAAH